VTGIDPSPHAPATAKAGAILPAHSAGRWIGAGLCAASAAGFASLSILGKAAFASGMTIPGMLSLRFGGAAIILGSYIVLNRRRRLYPGARLAGKLLLLGAVGYAGQSTLYFGALQRLPASMASLLLYVYPFFVALLDWLLNQQRPGRREWLAMAAAGIGVLLTLQPGQAMRGEALRMDSLGVVLVIASAAWYAGYIVISDRVVHRVGPMVSTAWIAAGAGLSFTLAGWLTDGLQHSLTAQQGLIVLGMILLSTILALGAFLAGMARVGPTAASLLSTLEPVFTVLLAALLLGERLTPVQTLGGGVVLAALMVFNWPRQQPAARLNSGIHHK
jgi:drug/metabolite transporter (DMT)-like permease